MSTRQSGSSRRASDRSTILPAFFGGERDGRGQALQLRRSCRGLKRGRPLRLEEPAHRTPDGNRRPSAVRRLQRGGWRQSRRRETDRVRESDQRPPQANRSLVVDRPHAHARRADQRLIPDSPAYKAGVGPGMKLVADQHAAVQPESAGRGSRSLEKAGDRSPC